MAFSASILILSKDESSYETLRSRIIDSGLVFHAKNAEAAERILKLHETPLILIELDVPGNMEALIFAAMQIDSDTQVILCVNSSEEDLARRCLRLGACQVLPRPCQPEMLRTCIDRAAEIHALRRRCKHQNFEDSTSLGLHGSSPEIRNLGERISKISAYDSHVLISGEPGTGKTRVATSIHAQGRNPSGRFEVFDCASIKKGNHEKFLFGTAGDKAPGALELVGNGTLYLRHVDAMDEMAQRRMNLALKEREFTRLGSTRAMRVNFRVISSTSVDLRNLVREENFQEELYWNLCAAVLEIPPLRERAGDIEELLRTFFDQACLGLGKKNPLLSKTLVRSVCGHPFPGNVRQLRQLAGLIAALCEGHEVSLATLPAQIMAPFKVDPLAPAGSLALKPVLHAFEKQFLLRILKAAGNNQSKAARILDIHRNTLILKMQELGIPGKRSRSKLK